MEAFLFVLAAVFILIFVSGGYVFFAACRRGKELPWLVEEELKKTPYGRFYDHIAAGHQWLLDHNAQDVSIRSFDGLTLHGLWVPAREAKGTILLVHGYRSSYLADFGLVFDLYHSLGLNLLIPDQRGHGKSQGKYITFGVRESRDMLAWLQFHNQRYGCLPMAISGLSMGASTVMYLADEALPDNVRAMIADCGFTSPRDILASVFKKVTHLPAAPSLWVADLFARVFAGFHLQEKDTRKTLPKNRIPILMVHGTADTFVPCDMTRQGYAVCGGEKQLLLVEGAEHGVSYLVDQLHYREVAIHFLRANMEVLE